MRDRREFEAQYLGTFKEEPLFRDELIELTAWLEEEPTFGTMLRTFVIKVAALNCGAPVRYSISINPHAAPRIVERTIAAIEDGKALPNAHVVLDKHGKSYINHGLRILGNTLDRDLKNLGYGYNI